MVITVAFIGFLVAGLAGSIMRQSVSSCPVYIFTIIAAPWFKRQPIRRFSGLRHRPGVDTEAKDLTSESRGLEAIAEGFRLAYQDYELLDRESAVYDALYACCQSQRIGKALETASILKPCFDTGFDTAALVREAATC